MLVKCTVPSCVLAVGLRVGGEEPLQCDLDIFVPISLTCNLQT